MSNDDFNLNLDSLFQPAWAQGSIEQDLLKKFGHHADHPEHSGQDGERHGQRRRDGERRGKRRGTRADNDRRGRDFGRRRDGGGRHGQRVEPRADLRRDESAPLPDVEVEFFPEEKGCEQLAAQIKTSARACPLFKLALLLLDKANCYNVRLTAKKSHQSLFICALDDSPWVKENEAVLHVLKNHLATFYQAERVPVEPPKGVYTFIAQYDGVLLGPPNYHDYQIKLHELHAERFARLPFEVFKSRVKISKDEVLLNQWREEQSFKTEYVCLNVSEPLRLTSMDELNKHFRETHKEHIIKRVETVTVSGAPSRRLACSGLQRLIRRDWEQLNRHPLPFATKLSQQFSRHGLQFFKVNKTVTYVNIARPKFLDLEAAPVSGGIRRIVEFINASKKCTRQKLLAALTVIKPVEEHKPAEVDPLAAVGEVSASLETSLPVSTGESAPAPSAPTPAELEQAKQSVLADLHWLVHQGFVLEYATNGYLETARKQAK